MQTRNLRQEFYITYELFHSDQLINRKSDVLHHKRALYQANYDL